MGFRNDKITRNEFTPSKLTESAIQAIHKRCFLTTPSADTEPLYAHILNKIFTGDKDTGLVCFKKAEIEKDKKNIIFMLGQLKSVHLGDTAITFGAGIRLYNDTIWTKNTHVLVQMYELASAANCISTFIKDSESPGFFKTDIQNCVPTLSPDDPNFEAWYKEYQAKNS